MTKRSSWSSHSGFTTYKRVKQKLSISFATTNLKDSDVFSGPALASPCHFHHGLWRTLLSRCLWLPGDWMLVRKIRAAGIDVFGTYIWPGDVELKPSGRAVFSVFSVVVVVVGCIWSLSYVGYHLLMENRWRCVNKSYVISTRLYRKDINIWKSEHLWIGDPSNSDFGQLQSTFPDDSLVSWSVIFLDVANGSPSKTSFNHNRATFHFHDYGRKR